MRTLSPMFSGAATPVLSFWPLTWVPLVEPRSQISQPEGEEMIFP